MKNKLNKLYFGGCLKPHKLTFHLKIHKAGFLSNGPCVKDYCVKVVFYILLYFLKVVTV